MKIVKLGCCLINLFTVGAFARRSTSSLGKSALHDSNNVKDNKLFGFSGFPRMPSLPSFSGFWNRKSDEEKAANEAAQEAAAKAARKAAFSYRAARYGYSGAAGG